jgi:hypothetical protein
MKALFKKKRKLVKKILFLISLVLLFSCFNLSKLFAANIYVDKNLTSDCTGGNYSVTSRNCSGSAGKAYNTIQKAVNAVAVGDKIYLRGGTYTESVLLPNVNGTAWTEGNYIFMASCNTSSGCSSNEWAKIQCPSSTGLGIYRKNGSSKAPADVPTSYWKFDRLEITGCRWGMIFDAGPIWIRYCYIHDNVYSGNCDDNVSGVWINQARQCLIEYSWFKDNDGTTSTANCGNITFDSDYYDDTDPTYFDPDDATSRNEVRYNLLEGSQSSLTHKNQQRFGTNTRTAAGISSGSYKDWGDKWHHNIVRGYGSNGIKPDQDNAQVYNNIVVEPSNTVGGYQAIQFGREDGLSSHTPILYNPVIYNNTIINSNKALGYFAGGDSMTSWHGYGWFYNNVIDQNRTQGEWQEYPIVIAADMATGYYATMTDMFIKNNLIHSTSWAGGFSNDHLLRGRALTYTMTAAEATFPSVAGNWVNTTASLFKGVSGADAYTTNGTFVIGSKTIANGGIGGPHPYLAGQTLPTYIGATNPIDNAWVAGVLSLSNVEILKAGSERGPWWITSTPKSP